MAQLLLQQLFFTLTLGTPEVAFPFNSQVPPVARVGEPYTFTFSSTTFKPNGNTFQYTLSGAPAWLTLNTASRTLSGTPGAGDVGTTTPTIIATDRTGSTSMDCTLVIVATPGPQLGKSISDQLAQVGNRSGPTTLTSPPNTALDFAFSPATFVPNGETLSYYATMLDHTPLPAWLAFDANSMHFTGTTPPLTTSPESFDILLIASDVPGFAGNWTAFAIVVSSHQLFFSTLDSTVNVGANQSCNIQNLIGQLLLDGAPISNDQLASASSDVPSWLAFDSQTLAITGSAPSSSQQQDLNVTVTASDEYGDVANTTLHIYFAPDLPSGAVEASSPTTWPSSSPSGVTSVRVSAISSRASKISDSTNAPTLPPSGSIAAVSTMPASKKDGIIAGVTIAFISAVLFFGLAICYCRSPSKRVKRTASALKRSISRRYVDPDNEVWRADPEAEHIENIEKVSAELYRTPEHPPQIALDFLPIKSPNRLPSQNPLPSSPNKVDGNRISTTSSDLNDTDAAMLDNISCNSWSYHGTDRPQDSTKLTNHLVRGLNISSTTRRHARQYSSGPFLFQRNIFRRNTGIPISRRLTGLGHGRASSSPNRSSIFSPPQPRAASYAAEILDAISQNTPSTSILSSIPPPARSIDHRRSLSRTSNRESPKRLSTTSPICRTHADIVRPVPRRQAHRSTFFAAGGRERGSPSSHHSSSRAHGTLLALATIYGSPDISSTCADNNDNEVEQRQHPLIVKPGDGSSPPPQAIICPNDTDHLLQRKVCAAGMVTPLVRVQTQSSARSGATWQTTASATSIAPSVPVSRSASGPTSELSRQWHRRVLEIRPQPPFSAQDTTHHRLVSAQSRFGARLRARLEGGFWPGPGVGSGSGVRARMPGSGRSSVIFADADRESEQDGGEEDVVGGAEGSESLYSVSSVGEGRIASELVVKGKGGDRTLGLAAVPIMERPRASYRLGGDRDNPGGSRASLGLISVGNNGRIEKSQGSGRKRLRLASGKGKWQVSGEGREWVGSPKGSVNSEKPVRGNEAFL